MKFLVTYLVIIILIALAPVYMLNEKPSLSNFEDEIKEATNKANNNIGELIVFFKQIGSSLINLGSEDNKEATEKNIKQK